MTLLSVMQGKMKSADMLRAWQDRSRYRVLNRVHANRVLINLNLVSLCQGLHPVGRRQTAFNGGSAPKPDRALRLLPLETGSWLISLRPHLEVALEH